MTTKVLYFVMNTKNRCYELWVQLKETFEGLNKITVDEVDLFLISIGEKYYIKELSYQLEIYNPEGEYVFCINKPN